MTEALRSWHNARRVDFKEAYDDCDCGLCITRRSYFTARLEHEMATQAQVAAMEAVSNAMGETAQLSAALVVTDCVERCKATRQALAEAEESYNENGAKGWWEASDDVDRFADALL